MAKTIDELNAQFPLTAAAMVAHSKQGKREWATTVRMKSNGAMLGAIVNQGLTLVETLLQNKTWGIPHSVNVVCAYLCGRSDNWHAVGISVHKKLGLDVTVQAQSAEKAHAEAMVKQLQKAVEAIPQQAAPANKPRQSSARANRK